MPFAASPVEPNAQAGIHTALVIVDVRRTEHFNDGHISGAVGPPGENWNPPEGLSTDEPGFLYCYSHVCHLDAPTTAQLAGAGYSMMEMDGGFKASKEPETKVTPREPDEPGPRQHERAVST